jgi:hypothetical protein
VYKRWDGTTASVVQWQREGLNSNAACREGRPKKAVEGEERNRERKRARERGRKRKRTRKWWGQRSGGGTSRKRAKQARQGKARKAGGKELEKRVAGEERVPLPRHKTYGAAPLLKTAFQSRLLGRRDTRA